MTEEKKKFEKFGKSKNGNFYIKDTIGVPHTYCIGAKHLELNEGIYLNIEEVEKKGARCEICEERNRRFGERILSHKEHEQGLLVACLKDPKIKKFKDELQGYLLGTKSLCEEKKYIGFSFLDCFSKKGREGKEV